MHYKVAISLALLALAAVLLVQNTAVVDIRLLFWTFSMSRALVVFFAVLIGFVAGWVWHGYLRYRNDKQRRAGVTRR